MHLQHVACAVIQDHYEVENEGLCTYTCENLCGQAPGAMEVTNTPRTR